MADGQHPAIEERDAQIVAAIVAAPDTPTLTLCRRFGVTRDIINKLRAKLSLPKCSVHGPRKGGEYEVISPIHHQIGLDIFHHRRFVLRAELTQASVDFKLSRYQLGLAERGAYNFDLTQLQHIAVVLGITLLELMTPRATRFNAAGAAAAVRTA